ncbi:sulfite exporter TauE/SafE family protein [Saccharospirillum impatiens]|uniref:sulfite exporter TauE/SafE family protein n=1 Tax=Saccharospirillum impatiens TaxID=169438 RepID=UPI00048F333C|nr:sulfite exporter TauE/SafE family protein [Saccharospirillum impatiens]
MTFETLLSLLPWLILIFLASGMVKGISGFGMPFIAIPASTILFNVPITQAMGWVLASGFATNLVQLFQARRHWRILQSIWLMVLVLLVTMAFTMQLLSRLNTHWLSIALGGVMVLSIAAQLARPLTVTAEKKTRYYLISGFFSGLFGGLTSFFGFPALQVLIASGLKKLEFIFATSFVLFSGTLVLAIGLGTQGLVTPYDGLMSVLLFIPAVLGMLLGQRLRERMSPAVFARVVLMVLLATGASMFLRGLYGLLYA